MVKRPLLGRISIRATFADDKSSEVREGDIRSAVAEAGVGKTLEKMLAPFDEIKRDLPRDSSALVLVATPAVNDRMVELFATWSPKVIRKDVEQEVERRLETFRQKTLQDLSAQAGAPH